MVEFSFSESEVLGSNLPSYTFFPLIKIKDDYRISRAGTLLCVFYFVI